MEDIDCIQNIYDEIKKDKHETTVYIHGYRADKNTISAAYIVSGIDNKILLLHIQSYNIDHLLN